jgi:hypothetical protein
MPHTATQTVVDRRRVDRVMTDQRSKTERKAYKKAVSTLYQVVENYPASLKTNADEYKSWCWAYSQNEHRIWIGPKWRYRKFGSSDTSQIANMKVIEEITHYVMMMRLRARLCTYMCSGGASIALMLCLVDSRCDSYTGERWRTMMNTGV